jgi:hypothetical protein
MIGFSFLCCNVVSPSLASNAYFVLRCDYTQISVFETGFVQYWPNVGRKGHFNEVTVETLTERTLAKPGKKTILPTVLPFHNCLSVVKYVNRVHITLIAII